LERPTDASVEIAVGFMKEVGAYLAEASPKANVQVFDRFRAVLHEGTIDKRVQYMIEVLFQVRKDQYKDNPIIPEGLDLVEAEDQITHDMDLGGKLEVQESLSKFLGKVLDFADTDQMSSNLILISRNTSRNIRTSRLKF
jgi:pre-mRNA-splicing factor CWC22